MDIYTFNDVSTRTIAVSAQDNPHNLDYYVKLTDLYELRNQCARYYFVCEEDYERLEQNERNRIYNKGKQRFASRVKRLFKRVGLI